MRQFFILICWMFTIALAAQVPDIFKMSCPSSDHDTSSYISQSSSLSCTFTGRTEKWDNTYKPFSYYPVYKIRVNFIFLQRSDGSGNFNENNVEEQKEVDKLIDSVLNNTYSTMVNPNSSLCYNGTDFISNAKIQFDIKKFFIRDDYGWNNQHANLCPDANNWYLDYLDNQVIANPNIPKGVNVYFTEDITNYMNLVVNRTTNDYNGIGKGCSQYPHYSNFITGIVAVLDDPIEILVKALQATEPDFFNAFTHARHIVEAASGKKKSDGGTTGTKGTGK